MRSTNIDQEHKIGLEHSIFQESLINADMNEIQKILAQIPFLRYLIPFGTGIYCAHFIPNIIGISWILAIIPIVWIALLPIAIQAKRDQIAMKGVALFMTLLAFGIAFSQSWNQTRYTAQFEDYTWYTGVVKDHTPLSNERQKYVVQLDAGMLHDTLTPMKETILLVQKNADQLSPILPGTRIAFNQKPQLIGRPLNPGEFNYQRFMNLKGIRYQLYCQKPVAVSPIIEHSFRTYLLVIRSHLLDLFYRYGITGNEFGVLAALTLGEKDYLTEEIKTGFSSTGAMHVLAVSGLHVGIIYLVLLKLLSPMKRNKRTRLIKTILIVALLWSYACITGLPASVFRSTTMFTFLAVGEGLNRKPNAYNSLAASAFVLMLCNPNILFEVGFQLSYLAVLSIVFFQPKFSELYSPKTKLGDYMWQLLCVSLAAQIGTSPISIFYFNQFPIYFWVSNFIVIPAAALILYTTITFFILSFIPFIASAIALLLKVVVYCLNWCILNIENWPGALLSHLTISTTELLLYYLLIISITGVLLYRNKKALYATFISILLLLSINSIHLIETQTQKMAIFYKTSKAPLISFVYGRSHLYYSGLDSLGKYEKSILENASKVYRTSEPIPLNDSIKNQTNWLTHTDQFIILEGITINTNETNQKRFNGNSEIILDRRNKNLTISKSLLDKHLTSFNMNQADTLQQKSKVVHQFQKDGAFLLQL